MILQIPKPYLVFLGDCSSLPVAKTAFGLRDWCKQDVMGQYRLNGCKVDLGVCSLTPHEAAAKGAKSLVIGAAPIGGELQEKWWPALFSSLEAGLDIVSGLHSKLEAVPGLAAAALAQSRRLINVRHSEQRFNVATGVRRAGRRLLTVGTDCAVGKKYTALAIAHCLNQRGVTATFRATGQTGIMIAGSGVALDAVVADFLAGAAEGLSPENSPSHWDIIEGQGALFHPGYAGVTLGLIHGSQPDALVLCHDPSRAHLFGYPTFPTPTLESAKSQYLACARLTNPTAQFVGVALNTAELSQSDREYTTNSIRDRMGVPVFDPLREGVSEFVNYLIRRIPVAVDG